MDKNSQEIIMQAAVLQQQSEETEQNLAFINNQLSELQEFGNDISFMAQNKGKEIFSLIGKGVYSRASLSDSDFFVNVGSGILVKKSREETKNIIYSQIEKLTEAKVQLMAQMENFHLKLRELIREIEKIKSRNKPINS